MKECGPENNGEETKRGTPSESERAKRAMSEREQLFSPKLLN